MDADEDIYGGQVCGSFLHSKVFFWKVPTLLDKGLPVWYFLLPVNEHTEWPSYFIVSFYSEFDKVIDIFGDTLYNINMQKLSGLENQEGRLIVLEWLTKTLNTVVCFINCFCFVRKKNYWIEVLLRKFLGISLEPPQNL